MFWLQELVSQDTGQGKDGRGCANGRSDGDPLGPEGSFFGFRRLKETGWVEGLGQEQAKYIGSTISTQID